MSETLKTAKARLVIQIKEACDAYRASSKQAETESALHEMEVRVAADDSFRLWRARHLKELNHLEKEYALAVIRESRRPVQAKAVLHSAAIQLAKGNDFQSSILLRERARNLEEAEMEDRRKKIEAKYRNLRAALFENQKNDLGNLNRNLDEDLKRLSLARRDSLDQPARRLLVTARLLTQKAVVQETATAKTRTQKMIISKTLNDAANAKLLQFSGFILNPASPKANPITKKPKRDGSSRQNDLPADLGPSLEVPPAADGPAEEPIEPRDEEEEEDRHDHDDRDWPE
jgi:hypothetical protein